MKNSRLGIITTVTLIALAILFAFATPFLSERRKSVSPAVQKRAEGTVAAKGVVESREEIILSSQVVSTIRKMVVDEGSTVSKGSTLVFFDDGKVQAKMRQAEAELAEARARLKEWNAGFRSEDVEMVKNNADRAAVVSAQAKDEFQRQRRLYEKEATSLIELRRAEERMNIAEAQAREAQANLEKYRKGAREEQIEQARGAVERASSEVSHYRAMLADYAIRSPIDGLVVEKLKHVGESTDVGTPVLKLIEPAAMRIRAELEESDVGRVKEGQSVEVLMDAYQGKIFTGKVAKVFPVVQKKVQKNFDPMASFDINTQKIHILLDDFSGLKNGMTVTVRFLK